MNTDTNNNDNTEIEENEIVEVLRDLSYIIDESSGAASFVMLSGSILSEAADEIERLRRLIREWSDANNFGSLYGDDLTKAVDRAVAAEQMLRREARRG